MPKIERFSEGIAWIDLSFVEHERTFEWAIQVGIQMSLGRYITLEC